METLLEPLGYAFFQKGLLVASLSGALLGLIGVYIVLRGMSYIGHGLSHSIFGGFAAMQLFAAQVFQNFPEIQTVRTSLVWLKTMEMDTETYYRSQLNEQWADVMKRIQRIYKSLEHDNWPMKPSGLCRFCPARHDCVSARV